MNFKGISILFTTFFILIFSTGSIKAQNLVPNWSFEDTVSCPTTLTVISKAKGWINFRESPDYFNSCATPGQLSVSVPENIWGYQAPSTGNAYAAILTYSSVKANTREFIGINIGEPLLIGRKYFGSFYVSPGVGYANQFDPSMATNKLGMQFSTVAYSKSNPQPIDNNPKFYSDDVIRDTVNWTKVSGSFIADSAYQYLSIGNFFTDAFTTAEVITAQATEALYYIDDVRLSTDSDFVNSVQPKSDFINDHALMIYPNPSTNNFTVSFNKAVSNASLKIYNMIGEEVYHETINGKQQTLITTLRSGIYFMNLTDHEKRHVQKLIVE